MKKLFILFLISLGCLSGCSKPSEMVSAPPVQEINSSQEHLDLQEFSNASEENMALHLNVTSTEKTLLGFTACLTSNNRVFLDMSNLSYPKATGYAAVIWCVNLINNITTYVGTFAYDPNKGIFLSKPPYDNYRYELDWYYKKTNEAGYYFLPGQKRQVSNCLRKGYIIVTKPTLPINNPVINPPASVTTATPFSSNNNIISTNNVIK